MAGILRQGRPLWAGLWMSLVLSAYLSADTWNLPGRERYDSKNGRFMVEVHPRALVHQLEYFSQSPDSKESSPRVEDHAWATFR